MRIRLSKVFRFRRKVNRKYKDVLFRFIFRDKKDLLSLYNAINGTDYKNPEELEINTLENVIYMKMKNDLSFLAGASMNLYEHQSTWNPNMPLRGLFYFAELYERYINGQGYRLTGSTRIPLPFPNYIVFYNGLEWEAERTELALSEAFEEQREGLRPALECRATILNINSGHNRELMEKCRRLHEYAEFIQRIRDNLQKGMALEKAVEKSIEYCLAHGILADILRKCQMEVQNMLLEEYDEKAEREYLRKESLEEGIKRGIEQGIKQGIEQGIRQGVIQGRQQGIALGSFEVLAKFVKAGIITIDQAKEHAGERKEEFILWYQKRENDKI
ncbi:MAG: hypothetical protein HFI24_03650 [Lachnospiraceae bacterium]|nr:hypothetical protein [Lachnospiraceae bacterium]